MLHSLEQNPKLGYYTVGTNATPIYNKLDALAIAEKTGAVVNWNFNSHAFGSLDWTKEPETDIDTFYRIRAQQLRDRYDYLILNYSGGVDSTNVLYSFLKNGIHLDEVVVRHPESALRDVNIHTDSSGAANTISEYEYAVKPRLQWIRDNYPNVKITVHDYFDSMVNEEIDESWIYLARDFFHPGLIKRYSNLGLRSMLDLYDKGKTVGIIFGIDKPRLYFDHTSDKYFSYFLDIVANTAISENGQYSNIATEFFYWTPDLPEMVVKQAHMLKKWYTANPQYRSLIELYKPIVGDSLAFVERSIVAPIVYPSTPNVFQCDKPFNSIFSEHDAWFFEHHIDSKPGQVWRSGVNELLNNFSKHIRFNPNGSPAGVKLFWSKLYSLQ